MIDPHLAEGPVPTTDRMLRQFAGLWVLFFGGLAYWQWFVQERSTAALVLAALAAGVGLPGLAWPRFIRPIFTALMAITYPIGWVISHLLLGILFCGVFTPVALFFRLVGRDALNRRKRPDLPSYWVSTTMPTDVRSYFRQS
jgi:hypothetical protein